MRFLMWVLQLFIAFYIARFIGHQLIAGKYVTIAILLIIIPAFLYLSSEKKFFLLSISALIPFNFPESFYLPFNGWIEILAPIVCLLLILENFYEKRPLVSRQASLFFSAIVVIAIWAMVNYFLHPVSGQTSFGTSFESRGLRNYFLIFVGITTFLSSFWFFRYRELDTKRWFYFLIAITLLMGYLRVIGYYDKFYIPIFHKNAQSLLGSSAGYLRITISGAMGALGIALLMCLSYRGKWKFLHSVLFVAYTILMILSAGRATAFGLLAGIIIYILFVNKRYFIPLLLSVLLVIIVFNIMSVFVNLRGQTNRLINVKTVSPGSFSSRYYTTLYALKLFSENPFFGKGIHHVKIDEEDEYLRNLLKDKNKWDAMYLRKHIQGQIFGGGHGSYTSIMLTFGLGGIFFIIVMVFGGIYHAYKTFKVYEKSDSQIVRLALFGFIYMVMLSLFLIPGGNGYNDTRLWFLVGMIAGLKVRAKERGLEVVKEEKREEYSGERLLWAEE
jgi:O-antigen ligase